MLGHGIDGLRWVPLWGMRTSLKMTLPRAHGRGLYAITATVSNMGQLPLGDLVAPDFRTTGAYIVPCGSDIHPFLLVLSGDDSGVSLVAAVPNCLASDGRLEDAMQAIATSLSEAAGFR